MVEVKQIVHHNLIILCAIDDSSQSVLLLLLDLSAAFDTVNHNLIERLNSVCGIDGAAYLCNRSQFVKPDDCNYEVSPLETGVPQGSVLGSLFIFSVHAPPRRF